MHPPQIKPSERKLDHSRTFGRGMRSNNSSSLERSRRSSASNSSVAASSIRGGGRGGGETTSSSLGSVGLSPSESLGELSQEAASFVQGIEQDIARPGGGGGGGARERQRPQSAGAWLAGQRHGPPQVKRFGEWPSGSR